jgi:hypothetical protein
MVIYARKNIFTKQLKIKKDAPKSILENEKRKLLLTCVKQFTTHLFVTNA